MTKALWVSCLLALAPALPAHALPIPTLYSTGVGTDGLPLGQGADPHYTLLRVDFAGWYSGQPLETMPPAAVSNYVTFSPPMQANVLPYTHPAWVPNGAASRWVSLEPSWGGSIYTTGLYTYQTTFDLTGLDPASVRISGVWGTDDPGWLFVNLEDPNVLDPARLAIGPGGGFGYLPPFELTGASGLFRPGLNTLTFVVWDAGNAVTGLRFEVQSATAELAVKTVAVDLMPGTFPNVVTPTSTGSLPVAILSAPDFDATTVVPATVRVQGAPVAVRKNGTLMAAAEDANLDGLLDLVVQVVTASVAFGDTGEVVVTGTTAAGLDVQGTDQVLLLAAE